MSLSSLTKVSLAETIRIALPSEGNPPYSYSDTTQPKGIYVELFNALFESSPYRIEFVYLSSARIRNEFKRNTIDIECCPLPSWREGEDAYSHYSKVAFTTEDIYVFPKNKVQSLPSLTGKAIATVSGYAYLHEKKFSRIDFNSELSILRMVANQRVELGIVDRYIAEHLIHLNSFPVDIGSVHEKALRPIRVHKNKKHILPELNRAISQLQKKQKIQKIFKQHGINHDSTF
ncbi:substrate-binding periplasmic protein [Litorilituus lipolyticus]|uniref:substrate-binding periplasmic protein n=1 Tax=Litorilituus lipolyticus TaxID=2491017 RepID=UPI001478099E|nr:transporter substrate-binding domain-containing protein [Litorilituus lipolyticus]